MIIHLHQLHVKLYFTCYCFKIAMLANTCKDLRNKNAYISLTELSFSCRIKFNTLNAVLNYKKCFEYTTLLSVK